MNSLLEVTQNILFIPARLIGQVEYSFSSSSQGQAPGPLFWICWLAFTILMLAAWWKVFTKAGQPGWACIIPIYNIYIWCKIVGRPAWWILLLLIPFVNFVICIILCIDLAKSFGKGAGFGIGLLLLGIIFFPILGFGSAQYQGPSAGTLAPRTAPQVA
ncbi:MAG TPA: DUF5684 domain-containing protein [Candidatus Udaeobacter sp.]|jgi:hypothetical protein